MDIQKINKVFSKLNFKKDNEINGHYILHAEGKDFGVYLIIKNDTFSIQLVSHHMMEYLFRWQYYSSYEEIYQLILNNHILSEQICESAGVSIHT